jgi:hypothetical protein
MSYVRSLKEVVDDWNAGELNRVTMVSWLMGIINNENVDQVICALPEDMRTSFVRFAREGFVEEDKDKIVDFGTPTPEVALVAIRGWMIRNPDQT